MKNQFIILLSIGTLLSSCGTTNQYVSSSYDDAIYYNPANDQTITINSATNDALFVLKSKTREARQSNKSTTIQEIILMDEDTTVIVPEESFEEILTKFDSPYYVVNINIINGRGGYNYWDDPYWSNFGFYNPWQFRHNRYSPWSSYYNWYGSDGWFYSPYYSYWNSPYYNPWYYGNYGYGYGYGNYYGYYGGYYGYGYFPYDSWYYSGGGSGSNYDTRKTIYGRRDDQGGYNNHDGGTARSGGSYVRREANVEQIRGDRFSNNNRTENSYNQGNESVYRRENRTSASGAIHNTAVVNSYSNRGSSTYQRSSNTYKPQTTTNQRQTVERNTEPVYRRSSQPVTSNGEGGRSVSSSSSRGSNNSSSSSYSRTPTYSPQPSYSSSNTNSGNSSTGNTSSGNSSSSSSSSSGSTYRR